MDPLTDVGVTVASEVATSLLARIKRHIGYLIKYKDNLKDLKAAGDQLDAKRTDASRFLVDADSKLKDVSSTTTLWRRNADELHKNAQDIFSVNRVSCLNLWSRYSVNKCTWELTQKINEKIKEAPAFGTTFDRPALNLGAIFNLKGFVEFESRLKVLNGVLEALKDDEVSMCSICGMGGMGKTTLAKRLIQRIEADHLFDKIAMVTVSQIPRLEVIQKEIIEQLGLKMDEGTTIARAKKLNLWLANNNTLLILDDVWWQLSDEDFENVGIPLESRKCKILLTSRNEDECAKMGSQRNFLVGVLEHEEAWYLFRQIAGKCVENLNLEDTARKIVDECDGLPIAIVTLAAALKDKPRGVWNDSLRKLQSSNLQRISGMEKVYSRIQLSYDLMNDKEAQSCFRLCCLFPEDSDISAEDLVFYGKGLEIFENVDSISEARDRVEAIIHKLKKSFLLLDGEEVGCVKIHDIMRDFTMSNSSDSYLVRYGNESIKWPEMSRYESCSGISLMFEKVIEHPVDLRCPNLKLLRLCFGDGSAKLPISIFDGMKELKVLYLEVPSVMQQLGVLKELRTLFIKETSHWEEIEAPQIEDLFYNTNLKYLESLSLFSHQPCNGFPVEIGMMCNLRFLEFHTMPFSYMPSDVLSKLEKLEELLLPRAFTSWGCKEEDRKRVNGSLNEIKSLPLTRLKIGMQEGSNLGEKFVENLKRFELFIRGNGASYFPYFEPWSIQGNLNALDIVDVDASTFTLRWMATLLGKSEILKLFSVRNLENLMFLYPSFQLKKIDISSCHEMEFFISKTVKPPCFSNLSHITIWGCSNLRYMFPLLVARDLRLLISVEIHQCDELEEIFCKNDADKIVEEKDDVNGGSQTMFPQLESLTLGSNHKLRVFYSGNEAIELPSLKRIGIKSCDVLEAFCSGSLYAPKLELVRIDDYWSNDKHEDFNGNLKQWKLRLEKLYNDEESESSEDELDVYH